MANQDIKATLFDGTVLNFPDGTSQEVINRVAKEQTLKIKGETQVAAVPDELPPFTQEEINTQATTSEARVAEDGGILEPTPELAERPEFQQQGRMVEALTEPFEDLQGRFEGLLKFAGLENTPEDVQRNFIAKIPKRLGQAAAALATVGGAGIESVLNVFAQDVEEKTGVPRKDIMELAGIVELVIASPTSLRRLGAMRDAPKQQAIRSPQARLEAPTDTPIDLNQFDAAELPVRGPTEPIRRPILEGVVEDAKFIEPSRIDQPRGKLDKANEFIDRAFPPERKVRAEILRAMELDNINLDDIPKIALEFEAKNGRRPSLSEITGENVEGVLGGSGGRLGKGRTIVEEDVSRATGAQTSEVERIADRTLSSPVRRYMDDIGVIEKRMKTEAKPFYDEAFAQNVNIDTPRVDKGRTVRNILETPTGKKALKNTRDRLLDQGKDPDAMGIVKDGKKITLSDDVSVEGLDAIKRSLDDIVEKKRDSTTGILTHDNKSRTADDLRFDLRTAIDEQSPSYEKARSVFAGDASLKDAAISGRTAGKSRTVKADQIKQRMERMNNSEQEIYRAGFMRGLKDQMTSGITDTNRIRNLLKTEDLRDKISAVFGDTKAADAFIDQLDAAANRVKKAQAASSKLGSQTALRQENKLGVTGGSKAMVADAFKAGWNKLRQDRNVRTQQIIDKDIAELLTQPLTDDVLKQLELRLQEKK